MYYIWGMENEKESKNIDGQTKIDPVDFIDNEKTVIVNRQFLIEVSKYISGLNPPDPITGAIMSVGEGISLENAIHIISRMNSNNEGKEKDAVEILRNHLEVRNCFTALTAALNKAGINAEVTLVIH